MPRTDKDWEKIRIGAVTLAEGVYLLKIRRLSRASRRREQHDGRALDRADARADRGEARSRSRAVECEDRSAAECRARSPRDREEERCQGALGRGRQSRPGHVRAAIFSIGHPGDKALLQKIDAEIERRHQESLRSGQRGRGR